MTGAGLYSVGTGSVKLADDLTAKSRSLLNELTRLEGERASFQASVDMIESVDRSSLESLMQLDIVAGAKEVIDIQARINISEATMLIATCSSMGIVKRPPVVMAAVRSAEAS